MVTNRFVFSLILLFYSLFSGVISTSVAQQRTAADELQLVAKRLIASVKHPPHTAWPPTIELVDKGDGKERISAWTNGQKVFVTKALLNQIVNGDLSRLAFILGHEIAHILLNHSNLATYERLTPFRTITFTREHEFEADQKGMALALEAGYSFQDILKGIKEFITIGLEYSAVEGVSVDHPSWKERLERLDKSQSLLWKSMSAFSNGAVFLQLEQYASAERCFRSVTKEFPECYEGWTNLGYSQLMQYCDKLEPEDIQMLGIAHLMVGGFYRRPLSLEGGALRGMDEELWWSAVGAFREALRLKNDLVLAKADLGICYLLHPGGKDVKDATRYFHEAVADLRSDTALDAFSKLTVLVNAGVSSMASGELGDFTSRLDEAERVLHSRDSKKFINIPLLYNRALLYSMSAGTDQRSKAMSLLERYLATASHASLWWNLGYSRYETICAQMGRTPKSVSAFEKEARSPFRPILSVRLDHDSIVSISDPIGELKKWPAISCGVPIVPNTNLLRFRSIANGVDIIGTDLVLAICLYSERSPALDLRSSGVGGKKLGTLFVGMSQESLDQLLGNTDYDMRELVDPETRYRFYYGLGVALRIQSGKISEIVIAQLPTQTVGM